MARRSTTVSPANRSLGTTRAADAVGTDAGGAEAMRAARFTGRMEPSDVRESDAPSLDPCA